MAKRVTLIKRLQPPQPGQQFGRGGLPLQMAQLSQQLSWLRRTCDLQCIEALQGGYWIDLYTRAKLTEYVRAHTGPIVRRDEARVAADCHHCQHPLRLMYCKLDSQLPTQRPPHIYRLLGAAFQNARQ